jgi:2-polyprenyl-3-methyl-5-hydroxy-6-metoxy-1,4-benzoquinol methylase
MDTSEFWNDELPVGYYDKIFSQEKSASNLSNAWHKLTFKKLASFLEDKNNHLDFACGPGTFIGNFKTNQSLGVDISEKQINYAQEKYGNVANFQTLKEFNFSDYENKFDIITVIGLLEFIDIEDTNKLINNLYTICKPGGKVIFTTPNYSMTFKALQFVANVFFPVSYEGQTITKYNTKNIRNNFLDTKFSNMKVKKILNFGIFLSIINFSVASSLEDKIEKLTKNNLGNLFLLEFTK